MGDPKPLDSRCAKCGSVGPFPPSFYKGTCSSTWCNPCYNKWRRNNWKSSPVTRAKHAARHDNWIRQSQYGISMKDWEAMLASQSGLCAACGLAKRSSRRPHVDHNHTTGKIRGIVCGECNCGFGFFDDSSAKMRGAVDYIETANEGLRMGVFE